MLILTSNTGHRVLGVLSVVEFLNASLFYKAEKV